MDEAVDGRHPGRAVPAAQWRRSALALPAGALPALTFPAPALWWLAPVALVPWLLLLRGAATGRRAARDGWLGGLGFMLAVHHWLLPSLHVFTVVLAGLLGLLWAPWGWWVRRLLGGRPGPGRAGVALLVLPSAWLAIEVVRSWQGLGGPWGLLGASQWQVDPALRLASLGGVWLVSLCVVAVNTALVLLLTAPGARLTGAVGLTTVAVGATTAWAWAPVPRSAGAARIAVVQPGVVDGPQARFARGELLTRSLVGRPVDLVVWGESSVGRDLADRPDLAERLAALSREVGADVLVNVDARSTGPDAPAGIYKSSVLVGPHGPTGDRYAKMRLVPFGEYVPARSLLGWATSVGRAADEDRRRGTRQVLMDTGGVRVGPLVCFESAFPDLSRRLVERGAGVLVAQSATSTFQDGWAPAQHASLAALRAAETGRSVVHATLTGISAVHGPAGEPVGPRLGTRGAAAQVYRVPLATGTTAYVRFGAWPVGAALLVLGAYAGTGAVRRIRRRPARPAPGSPAPPARRAHGWPTRPAR
ncbi:apolipoprotein N-acyltransferase [Streptomyces sp. LE64]|uniref:apolipoprotein N-acyltransferase n=1 Tax=Streptomyces sp. LE64 TaxID=3448653 RepID=UPI0040432741